MLWGSKLFDYFPLVLVEFTEVDKLCKYGFKGSGAPASTVGSDLIMRAVKKWKEIVLDIMCTATFKLT